MPNIVSLANLEAFQAVNLNSDPGHVAGPKIIPNCAMVRINWTLTDGRLAHNVLAAQYTGSPAMSQAMAEGVRINLVSGATWTALAAFLIPTAFLTSVTVLDLRSTTATEFTSNGPATPGTSTGTAIPDEVSAVITLKTARRGQGGRGRIFVPGWGTNAIGAGGVIAAAAVTALQNWSATINSAVTGNVGPLALGLPHRVAYTSPKTGRQFPDRPAEALQVTSLLVRDNHWDSQRRRGLK